jgi:hypothetical protein
MHVWHFPYLHFPPMISFAGILHTCYFRPCLLCSDFFYCFFVACVRTRLATNYSLWRVYVSDAVTGLIRELNVNNA